MAKNKDLEKILDDLTNVTMPTQLNKANSQHEITINGLTLPIYEAGAIVVGTGAAGWRAAVELKRRDIDVLTVSTKAFWGTSACSGSDKQTLHTACTRAKGDDYIQMQQALSAGGAMDLDTAYVEAVGSIDAHAILKFLGLDLPQDKFGAVLRYQTDHDEFGRATSCGPRTSRLMVKVLAQEAIRLGVRTLDHTSVVRLLTHRVNGVPHVTGAIAIDKSCRRNPYRLVILKTSSIVLATGGPGELYRDSVYPKNCFGSLGMALESGLSLCNLTESQFGIGTRRDGFPWNLSGTYVQALPRVYSEDAEGKQYNFLADYFRTTQELVSNVFRKGYQWPFHATRMLDYGSSLVDIAVVRETQKGRKVFLDFLNNPETGADGQPFSLERLDSDVHAYLENNNALLDTPLERLKKMNPLSIRLYQMHGRDITKQPLEFAMNNQHMNGGIEVDTWGCTNLAGCYAIGEVAGTHGVTRPGGAALNAGQVFGQRCAIHIENHQQVDDLPLEEEQIVSFINQSTSHINTSNGLSVDEVKHIVQNTMSDFAGIICNASGVASALEQISALNNQIQQQGISVTEDKLVRAWQWQQSALSAQAILSALHHYISHGGGSRGARAICSDDATCVPQALNGPLLEYAFIPEQEKDKDEILSVSLNQGSFLVTPRKLRPNPDVQSAYFEKNWIPWLLQDVFETA